MNSLGMERLALRLIYLQIMNNKSPLLAGRIEGRGHLSIVTLSPTLSRSGRGNYSSPYFLVTSSPLSSL
jgi:hypothetical protein